MEALAALPKMWILLLTIFAVNPDNSFESQQMVASTQSVDGKIIPYSEDSCKEAIAFETKQWTETLKDSPAHFALDCVQITVANPKAGSI